MSDDHFEAAMYGTVMRGMPHHDRIAGAVYRREAKTVPGYRLLSVGGEYPLLLPDRDAAGEIAVQVFSLTREIWRGKVDAEPEGLYEGSVQLDDGTEVAVMLGEPGFAASRSDVEDITNYGGWANFIAATRG